MKRTSGINNKWKVLAMSIMALCLLIGFREPANAAAKTSIKVMTVGENCTVKKASLVKSSKNNVASVTKIGGSKYKVNILKKGKSTIKVYDKNGKLTKRIYLLAANNKSFNYDSTALYLRKGSSKTVKASSNISGVTVKYASSDESVATVDSAGKITAKNAGTATIKARFYYKGECVRKINKKVYVYKSSYSTTSISITAGNTKSVAPSVSSNCAVAYSSSDSSIASVNSKGVLTAKKKGNATITTKVSVNGTPVKTYTIKVTVKAKSSSGSSSSNSGSGSSTGSSSGSSYDPSATASEYVLSESSLIVDKRQYQPAFIYITAAKYADIGIYMVDWRDTFTWKCSSTSVVSISPNDNLGGYGCYITGKSKGTATVTCVVNGLVSYTCEVTVTDTDGDLQREYDDWRTGLEKELWTSGMTAAEKIKVVGDYVFARCPYVANESSQYCYKDGKGGNCVASSSLLVDIAHDLGLEAELYTLNGMPVGAGHTVALIYIDGVEYYAQNTASAVGEYGYAQVLQSGR